MATPGQGRIERRLAAVLAADVAGYSRLMGSDEAGTARALREHRAAVDPIVASHGGRIVKTTGDGVLLEFSSIVAAVECAVAVQKVMTERNAEVPEDRRMLFRIGINLGDVLIEGDDILGDGVNVAARLEGIAEPGGICISASAYDHVRGKVDAEFADLGDQQLKNIERAVRAYRLRVEGPSAKSAPHLALPDKPSIAVLPFTNLSGDPNQEYFSDGITEDIITELSRFSELFVIARNSSFQYKGKSVDVRQIGRELGVRHILEGSIRRGGERVRITAQLIDCEAGAHRWAERYDRELKDVFAVQDDVARTIVAILAAHLNKAEIERSAIKPPATWQAYDWYMRAAGAWASFLSSWKTDDLYETRRFLDRSLSIDPKYARAYAMLSSTHRVAWINPLDAEHLSPSALDKAIRLSRKAIELDPNLPDAYAELGYLIIRRREYDAAVAACERAIALNPNFADYRLAGVFVYAGELARAIELANAHMRLDPFHPALAPLELGIANYLLKQYREAQRLFRECTGRAPNHRGSHVWLAATCAQLDQLEEARAEAAEVLRISPRYTINGTTRRQTVFKRAEDIEHLVDGLRKAGLPE